MTQGLQSVAAFLWGPPLIVLLVGGGIYFAIISRLQPYRYFGHALAILAGRYDKKDDPGDLSHLQALSAALSGTLGMGNIAGVALAIGLGGPGAVFWMWVTAIVGVATKFFTCTLSVMYRGKDSRGDLQGGPMYIIREGLGPRWHWLATLFAAAALIGTLPIVQINQLTQVMRDVVFVPAGLADAENPLVFNFLFGLFAAALVASVIFGGVKRLGYVTARLVPFMVGLYLLMTFFVLARHLTALPSHLWFIVQQAFNAQSVAGGLVGVMTIGVMRGAFSNEAGIGTEVMAHGAAKTKEPVREGLVAMMGPVIDTLIVCTCTALVILVTGVWETGDLDGVSMTAMAFSQVLPGNLGAWLIAFVVLIFACSTMFTFWYYGAKCLGFLIGAHRQDSYKYYYTALVLVGAIIPLEAVFAIIDSGYALMAIPTMTATLLLSGKVTAAASVYFSSQKSRQVAGN
ncbi:MAG: amino acid carrier protein [Gammaproteobacteria bacterium]|nr:amino acid carrier protein [Gammaproteobacteria bacterium]